MILNSVDRSKIVDMYRCVFTDLIIHYYISSRNPLLITLLALANKILKLEQKTKWTIIDN